MVPDPQIESVKIQNPHYSLFRSPPLAGRIENIKNSLLDSLWPANKVTGLGWTVTGFSQPQPSK
jgi:hypothetical protein